MPAPERVEAVLRHWRLAEHSFAANHYTGEALPGRVRVERGTTALVLTAPHAVAHFREGRTKIADVGTGGLATAAAAATGSTSIVQAGAALKDANWYPDGELKGHLAGELPTTRAVLDLHGMRDNYGMDVCIGTGLLPETSTDLVDRLCSALDAAGLMWTINDPFDASKPGTVTSFCQAGGVPSAQLELSRTLRTPGSEHSQRFISALIAMAGSMPELGQVGARA